MAEDDNDIQDTMKGPKGEWFLYIIAVFVVMAFVASWAGGWWNEAAQAAARRPSIG